MSQDQPGSGPQIVDRSDRAKGRKRTGLLIGAGVAVIALVAGGIWWGTTRDSGEADAGAQKTLTAGLQLLPENLDIRSTAGIALEVALIDNVYEGLVSSTPDGTIEPSLASEWEVTPDGLGYSFTLAEGTAFADGTPLAAEDVVQSLQQVIDEDYTQAAMLGSIDAMTAPDERTVELKLSEPDPQLLFALAGRPGVIVDVDADVDLKSATAGSGPFTVQSWNAGDRLVLERNPEYWGEAPALDTVTLQLFENPTAIVNAVNDGSIDYAPIMDPQLVSQVEGADGYELVQGFSKDAYTLAFNNRIAPFDDIRVREAIRLAIDHDALVAAVGGGSTLYGPIVDSDPGYEDLSEVAPHDVEAAKALLDEAGLGDGAEFTVTISNTYSTTITDVLTSQLAEVGIDLTVRQVEFATWLNDVFTNHDYELSIVNHAEARDFNIWTDPDYYFGYDDAEVQDLYARASTSADEAEFEALLAQAARQVSEDHAADWLFSTTPTVALRDGLTGAPTDAITTRLDFTKASFEG